MAFVYLLSDSGQDNMFKIGVTRNKIEKRIKQLQTGNGNEIFLIKYYETDYPFFIERLLHMKFFPKQNINEWFTLEIEDVNKFNEYCSSFEETAKSLKDNPFSSNILK